MMITILHLKSKNIHHEIITEMKSKYIIGLLMLLTAFMPELISAHGKDNHNNRQQRTEWNREMLQAKIDYISRELDLSDEQKMKFAPIYESMDKEISQLMFQTRKMSKEVYEKGDKATDLELEKASEAMFEMKGKENQVEMKYYKQLKSLLTPRQLFKYKMAERKFNREIMEHHRKTSKK